MASGPRFYMPKAIATWNGVAVPGAQLNFYITGSPTRAATFSNESLTIANQNPLTADANGVFGDIFLNPDVVYKVVYTGPDDGINPPVEYWTTDPVDEAWTLTLSGFNYQTFSFLTGHPPDSQQTIGAYTALYPQQIFPNFDGTSAGFTKAWGFIYGKPSAADFNVLVYVNSILLPAVGEMVIQETTGAFSFSTVSGLPIQLNAGDALLFVAPVSTDPTAYNIVWTIPILNQAYVDLGVLGGGGGGGGGNVIGPGSSTAGHLVVWGNNSGTLIADAGAPAGALAFLNTITASLVSDFNTAVESFLATALVDGTNMAINHVGHTFVFNASGGGGGGNVTGPGSSTNGALVTWNGIGGTLIADSAVVPSANGLTLIAHTFAQMRTDLGLGTAALQNTGTSGSNVPLLNGANTWAAAQTFSVAPVFTDQAGSRTALGLGTAATHPVADFAQTANNLSDLANATTARSNLGLGSAATHAATDFEPAGAYSGVNLQTGTTYTFVLSDQGQLCCFSNASPVTVTIPPNSSVAFPLNARIDLAAEGVGQVNIAQGAGVTIHSSTGTNPKLRTQYSGASLVKRGTDTWLVVGDLA